MTINTTTLLGLALPVQGTEGGTWGDTVNNSITSLLDSAVAGTTTLSTDLDVTLTTTTLAANQARQAILLCSGARTAIRTITAPAQSKIYTVINSTTGGYSVKLVGVGPTTGVTIASGESSLVAWNGSDFIKIIVGGPATFTNVTVSGTTTLSGLTASTALALDSSKNVVSVTNTGTGNNVLATSPTLVTPILGTPTSATLTNATGLPLSTGVTGTLATTNGGTGLTSFTSGGLVYASSTSALTTGSALTYSASTLNLTSARLNVSTSGGTTGITSNSDSTAIEASASNVADAGIGGFFVGNQYSIYATSGTNIGGSVYPIVAYFKNTKGFSDAPVLKVEQNGSNTTGPALQLSVTGTSSTSKALNVVSGAVTLSGLTASTALALDSSKNIVSVTNTGTGNNVLDTSPTLVTPILGTPTSGDLSNCTFPSSLTTNSGASTLTNKRINPRVSSTTSTATLTPDISSYDQYNLTAQAVGLTVAAPTGTPVDGNKMMIRILDNGTSQTISWNATYTVIGAALPTSTTANKIIYVGCIYNAANTRWDVVAVTIQA